MDPCPFVRIAIGNLALRYLGETPLDSLSYYCRFKLKGFPVQFSDVSFLGKGNDAFESRISACFSLNRSDFDKLAEKSSKFYLRVEILRPRDRGNGVCRFVNGGKLLGCVVVQLDMKAILENLGSCCNRACVVQNGWVSVDGADAKLRMNVRAEPDPRFVFRFDGEPECSPQIFQVNGNLKQPVFTCKFGFRNPGDGVLRSSRSVLSEPCTSSSCFTSAKSKSDDHRPTRKRKGWSITIHDLQGSPVAAASMVTPFVPSPGSNRVTRSSPGAWLILRPGQATWRPWGRLEAWRDGPRLGYRFDLIPDCGGGDTVPLASSAVDARAGGKVSIDITTGRTPLASSNSSFDLGSGSGSDPGLGSASGSWAHLLYQGFVMSSTVAGRGRAEVEVGAAHVTCAEDAAVFVALAAAMDLSVDACRSFTQRLRKELRQSEPE